MRRFLGIFVLTAFALTSTGVAADTDKAAAELAKKEEKARKAADDKAKKEEKAAKEKAQKEAAKAKKLKPRPDVAIEVVWTAGGIDKLDVYHKLRVSEVWIWKDGRIQVHVLRGIRYEEVSSSEALSGIDLEQLVSFLDRPTASQAIRDYRAALRGA
jgi:Uma2 family endonuclease